MGLKPRTGRWRRAVGATAVVVALPFAVPGAAGPSAGAATASGRWSGLWMSSTTDGASTTLRDVRDIINASSGTAAALTGAGVGVAMIDTGVAPVPGLPAAQLVNGPDLSFESQASHLRNLDTYGHGTHMAGIIVANDSTTGTLGLAPKAKLTSLKLGTSNGAVDVTQVIAAIDWVVKNRNHDPANPIRVLNLSYGSGGNSSYWTDPLQFAVEKAWQAGIVVVAAGGNNGNDQLRLTNPATDPFLIAVGASATKGTVGTADDELAPFSNMAQQERMLDILAPGTSIVSLRNPGSNIDESYSGARVGETLFRGSGSSQAAAVTSAAVALILQHRPSLTPDQVKRLIIDNGTIMRVGTAAARGIRELNVAAALTAATPAGATQTWTRSDGLGTVQNARGTSAVVRDNVALSGQNSIFGPFDSARWAAASAGGTAWQGGMWMGNRMAGDGWLPDDGAGASGPIVIAAGRCLDVQWGNATAGTPVQLWDCLSNAAQTWTLSGDGSIRSLGKCLDVQNGSTANGTAIRIWDCNGLPAQQWRATAAAELVNPASGKCLDAYGQGTANGTKLVLWDCTGATNQKWLPPFADKTWAGAAWSGRPWSGAASWVDPDWSGRFWSGRFWSGRFWSARFWSTEDWSTAYWG